MKRVIDISELIYKSTLEGSLYEIDRKMNDALNDMLMPKEIEYYKFGR